MLIRLFMSSCSRRTVQRAAIRLSQCAVSQDLFDDLSSDPKAWALAQKVEGDAKPPPYASRTPIIDRPFEDALWFDAIDWPFKNLQSSRFGGGGYGVWYGSESVEITVFISAYYWYTGLLQDAGFENRAVVGERKVYWVACHAALLDMLRHAPGCHWVS